MCLLFLTVSRLNISIFYHCVSSIEFQIGKLSTSNRGFCSQITQILPDFTSSFYRRSKKINNALGRWYWAIVMLKKSLRIVLFPIRRRGLLKVSNSQKMTHMIFWEIDLILDGKFLTLLDVWVRLWCQIQSNSYFGFLLYTLFHH